MSCKCHAMLLLFCAYIQHHFPILKIFTFFSETVYWDKCTLCVFFKLSCLSEIQRLQVTISTGPPIHKNVLPLYTTESAE